MRNLTAELADNLKVYSDFTKSRSAAAYPDKMDVPMVWDLYMDTEQPVTGGTNVREPVGFEEDSPAPAAWNLSTGEDDGLLGQINDRLKTQSRRYPHPLTNEMEELN